MVFAIWNLFLSVDFLSCSFTEFIISSNFFFFLVKSLELAVYRSKLSVNRDPYTFSFLIWMPFIFPCLTALRLSTLRWTEASPLYCNRAPVTETQSHTCFPLPLSPQPCCRSGSPRLSLQRPGRFLLTLCCSFWLLHLSAGWHFSNKNAPFLKYVSCVPLTFRTKITFSFFA